MTAKQSGYVVSALFSNKKVATSMGRKYNKS